MNGDRPKLFLFGTPELAVAPFEALYSSGKYEICGVITQSDKPSGRGQELTPPPVKEWALSRSIPVFQPQTLRGISLTESNGVKQLTQAKSSGISDETPDWITLINGAKVTAGIAVAYGKIIPKALIDLPQFGIINIHLSLLPRWRGAAPIHRAISSGDKESGVTLMSIDEGLDTGPIYCLEKVAISEKETLGTLTEKLSHLGAKLLLEKLPGILSGRLQPTPQPTEGVTYAEKWQTAEYTIYWNEPAEILVRRIRACTPPGARTTFQDGLIKIFAAHPVEIVAGDDGDEDQIEPGTIVAATSKELIVAAGGRSYISIDEIQLAGKKRLPVAELLRGTKFKISMRFGG